MERNDIEPCVWIAVVSEAGKKSASANRVFLFGRLKGSSSPGFRPWSTVADTLAKRAGKGDPVLVVVRLAMFHDSARGGRVA
jgi:hypothetical protein